MLLDSVRCLRRERFGGVGVGRARCWVLRDREQEHGFCDGYSLGPSFMSAVVGCGVGTARTLRTTQWTRASSRRFFVS